jgi:hypothetical protein
MKKITGLVLILLILFSSCDKTGNSDIIDNTHGSGVNPANPGNNAENTSDSDANLINADNNPFTDPVNTGYESGTAELDASILKKVVITDLQQHKKAEYTESGLIKELCALLNGLSYYETDTEWEPYYQVDLIGTDGDLAVSITTSGRAVAFDRDIKINGVILKKGLYEVEQWIHEHMIRFSEGQILDPACLEHPAALKAPEEITYQEIYDKENSRVNSYEINTEIYDFLEQFFAGKKFNILSSRRYFSYMETEKATTGARSNCQSIVVITGGSESDLEIYSDSPVKQFAKIGTITLSEIPERPGVYKMIMGNMEFEIETGSDFDAGFKSIFEKNRRVAHSLTPDDLKTLYEENKPIYMEYICKNLGVPNWTGRPPDRFEITTVDSGKPDEPYTIAAFYNPFDVLLLFYTGGNGQPWRYIGFVPFGGRGAGTEYRVETWNGHIWITGNESGGHGTGESRYLHNWYELTDKGIRSVLSFPYEEYFVAYMGGYILKADSIKTYPGDNSDNMKVVVDYTLEKRYALSLDISDEYGHVAVSSKVRAEYEWDEENEAFTSAFPANELGTPNFVYDDPEITKQCDKILEQYYNELVDSIKDIEAENDEFSRRVRVEGLKTFLRDCSDGQMKADLTKILPES